MPDVMNVRSKKSTGSVYSAEPFPVRNRQVAANSVLLVLPGATSGWGVMTSRHGLRPRSWRPLVRAAHLLFSQRKGLRDVVSLGLVGHVAEFLGGFAVGCAPSGGPSFEGAVASPGEVSAHGAPHLFGCR